MIHANLHNRFILVEFISHKITPIALKQFFIPWPFKSHILKLKDENYQKYGFKIEITKEKLAKNVNNDLSDNFSNLRIKMRIINKSNFSLPMLKEKDHIKKEKTPHLYNLGL